jgi:transglutaminase-like putative cysteine protease
MQRTKQVAAMAALALVAELVALQSVRADKTAGSGQRSFAFSYEVQVPGDSIRGQHRLWIPLPQSGEHQSIHQLLIESAVAHSEGKDREYGNSYAVFSPTETQAAAGYDVRLKFEVTRQEFARDLQTVRSTGAKTEATRNDVLLQRYLQPDKLVPLNARIAELAKEQTEGTREPLEKARRIYTYVASTMRYDKSGEGWGRGDAMWACDSKRGNCTDFHSVLIGMMRSSGIPARFEIGFPLPEGKSEGDIPGYHCWAEFYLDGVGWVPVDASEASKFPAKRGYFFGSVDADRVMFTYGRDIRLSTEHQGAPLNYFIYPYAEANGRPLQGLKTHFAFHDLTAPGAARSGR